MTNNNITKNTLKRTGGLLLAAAMSISMVFGAGQALADTDYPTKPVRILVPFGPGGLADITMRLAGEKLSKILGQQFIVENHPGAGGVAAANELLKADPDGHTLVVMSNGTTIATSLFKKLSYDPQKQFAPISTLAWFDLGLFVNPDSSYDTLQSLVAKGKANPDSLNIATVSPGSTQNLAAEFFLSVTGIKANIIPYRTSPDTLAALLRGDVDLVIESPTAYSGAIKGKQVRVLAITGAKRNPSLPDVPTVKEAGVDGYEVSGWNALYTRVGVPDDVIAKLNAAITEVANMSDIQEKFFDLGIVVGALTPSEMADRFEADRKKWSAVIESAGIEKR
ncbi:MAG: tripartite tricarboxylate transporter receptor protein [Hyphomicrobiales bacterium]|nr:MAG: tripartite tricarboxylate transporter receptor protein [Hyphomicrobiales bacterium]